MTPAGLGPPEDWLRCKAPLWPGARAAKGGGGGQWLKDEPSELLEVEPEVPLEDVVDESVEVAVIGEESLLLSAAIDSPDVSPSKRSDAHVVRQRCSAKL